ncbi:phage tail assembly protein [Paraburkholderia sp. PREW-6R]|uniref:phage tail assembly protein n=1 Tax=Paraburkholderia sp. PREW-6R TaxID=3141544 RepID=UPI0031F57F50
MSDASQSQDEKVVKLSRPVIDQNGKQHGSLTLREPSGAAYEKIGDAYHMLMIDGKQSGIELNRARLLSYVAEVTQIHRPLLVTMPLRDIRAVTDEMFAFLG